ncbi:uncharacterized protein PV07_05529 [Cladophialophora immunda]|uniref:Zn(2)-C6 fungal-type domain-containing protein n=1 Tax=Cladophialophora immunda TaxID=569365 RepID=A0A0D2CHT8_9EURO|nr:uncharacterized protein PV07_05529 [Cladophialophora immunda]KIW29740.1 hypothetical protein PV07_05529 [Cladophialophora immunda]
MTPRTTDPQSRASAACTACRIRRTKCIVDPGHASCDYCQSKGMECTFQALDDRKRPKSKVYLNSLLENIQSLEQRLREAGHEPPQFQHSVTQAQPTQQHRRNISLRGGQPALSTDSTANKSRVQATSSLEDAAQTSLEEERIQGSPASADACMETVREPSAREQIKLHSAVRPRSSSEPYQLGNRQDTVWNLIYGPDRFIYDKRKGRIHYFSPSTCYKRYLSSNGQGALEPSQLDKHSYKILADIPTDLESYLMDLFWSRYNSTLCVIDQQAFRNDQASGGSTYYSGFLHLACLAMGFRFADKTRRGMQQVTLSDTYSVFQREAKFLLDRELEDPQGLTIIQAMLVLSDLECAYGRDDLAAMHIATSCRLAFDFGLNLDCSRFQLSEAETKFRKDLLHSCLLYDQAWALYVERPTNMKIADISSSCLANRISHVKDGSVLHGKSINESLPTHEDIQGQILDALLELSELSSRIQALAQPRLSLGRIADEDRLIDVAALDAKLKSWYTMLPPRLAWTEENIRDGPRLFFIMHQQFHVAQLNLHGPYGRYEDALGVEMEQSHVFNRETSDSGNVSALQHLARSITMNAAMKIAQGFSTYQKRFGTCETGVFALQQGGTALLALMSTIKVSNEAGKRNSGLHHLYTLTEQLREMSQVYSPAEVMCHVVKREMERLDIDFNDLPTPPNTPVYPISPSTASSARRPHSRHSSDSDPASKRRRLSTDQELLTVSHAPRQHSNLDRTARLSGVGSSDQHGATKLPNSAPPPLELPDGQSSGTLPTASFESIDPIPDTILDLNDIQCSSWAMGLSDISTLFDFQGNDQIGNEMLLPFAPDNQYLPGIDPNLRILPDVMQYG